MSVYMRIKEIKSLFFFISVTYVWYVLVFNGYIQGFKFKEAYDINLNKDLGFQLVKAFDEKFTIQTDGCTIPALKLNDEMLENLNVMGYPKDLKPCVLESPSLDNNKTHIWIVRSNGIVGTKDFCCYKSFYRTVIIKESVYQRVTYRKCVFFNESIRVKSRDEFVRVICNFQGKAMYDNFFLFAPKKKFMGHGETKEISKNKSAYNVIVLGLDAMSRLNFHRTMPKTLGYIQEIGAIELLGYNKIGESTKTNMYPLLMGIDMISLKKTFLPYLTTFYDNCPFIWDWFKKTGYYTALAEDSSLGLFNYLRRGFLQKPTDYYTHAFILEAEKYGNNKIFKRFLCSQDKYFYEILLDYIENLTMTLKSSKLFGIFWEVSISYEKPNYPMMMDDRYAAFFETLFVSNYLNDTILFLISDHGMKSGEIFETKQGRLESRLPFVYILVPPSFREKYSEAYNNLKLNSLRLTTPFDLYATLFDLVDMRILKNEEIAYRSQQNYSKERGISLFLPVPGNRTCSAAGIDDHWCTCHNSKQLSVNGIEARQASLVLEGYLGTLLESHPKCERLKVTEVKEVKELLITYGVLVNDVEWREFLIVVRMWPGGGIFEAMMRYDDVHSWSVVGAVGRLNAYGNQSYCTPHFYLKIYCYCL